MKTAAFLLFICLQILLPDPGCPRMLDSWQHDQKRAEDGKPALPPTTAMCVLLRCPDLTDEQLRACYHRKCADLEPSQETQEGARSNDGALCVQEKCPSLQGALLKACALYKCGEIMASTTGNAAPVERRGGVRGLWPDEFETRMVERGMWPDEYETRDARENEKRASPDSSLIRRARSEATDVDEIEKAKSVKKSIQKRWSTRLCMESHCKNAHSKVQYFMCGQMHCHR